MAKSIEGQSLEEKKRLLSKCAATTLSSKLIGGEKEFFASMVVDAVGAIGDGDRLNMIGIKKVLDFWFLCLYLHMSLICCISSITYVLCMLKQTYMLK